MSTIEPPAAVKSSFLRRKVVGVPVLYLLLAGVLVLAVIAWRARSTVTPDAPVEDDPAAYGEDGSSDLSQTDGGSTPTFVANQVPTYADSTSSDEDGSVGNATITSNDQWLKKSVEWKVANGESAGTVTTALQKYLNGDQLSFAEGKTRDDAVRQFGLPPDGFTQGSTKAQITKSAPGGTHTVQGDTDNTYHKLAALYFTDNDQWFDNFQAANSNLGNSNGPFPVGTKVKIPVYRSAKYYTTTKTTNTSAEVAKKNGISVFALNTMNDGVHSPYKVGTRLRVG